MKLDTIQDQGAFAPEDPEGVLWDAVVVGTGMGGATVGHALAAAGWRVLFLEKGRFLSEGVDRGDGRIPLDLDESPEGRLKRGWWPHRIEGKSSFGDERFFAPLGCGTGGTSALYAAQLERLRPSDFRPRENFPNVTDSTLPEAWPVSYEELVPYYRKAEALYRVRGTADPLETDPDSGAALHEPPPLSERDQAQFDSFQSLGLHPYRAHVGYEYAEGCEECGAILCPRECKNDSDRICLVPALKEHGAQILNDCEVLELDADAERVRRVRCRAGKRELSVRGRVIVLSAGALMSPVIMLRSRSEQWPGGVGNGSDQVGRNLMVHAHDLFAVGPSSGASMEGPRKATSLNDFYHLEGKHKLGTMQSIGVTLFAGTIVYYLRTMILGKAPEWLHVLLGPFLKVIGRITAYVFRNAAVFATIIEDLPYAHNRVVPDDGVPSGFRFNYDYPEELRQRVQLFRERLRGALRPRHRLLRLTTRNNLDWGHMCGTVRFGEDPKDSVLDRNNRAHEVENLYVVDASFLPSSGGINLSLTIAANALRAAEGIDRQLRETAESSAPESAGS